MADFEFFRTDVTESQWTSSTGVVSARAHRFFVATSVGAVVHRADYAYGLAGVGWALEGLRTRRSTHSDWEDGDGTWRPRAFVGSGIELRRGRLGVDLEARAVALGGSGPNPTSQMSMIATPEVGHFSLQVSMSLAYFRP